MSIAWVKYKRLNWVTEGGYKYYEGRFREGDDLFNHTDIFIRFYTKHPVKAMRYICQNANSIEDVSKFNEQKIDFN